METDTAFDLILCDVMMPDMTGIELHEWLTHERPVLSQKVVFISGGVFAPNAFEYLAKVGNRRLQEPFGVNLERW